MNTQTKPSTASGNAPRETQWSFGQTHLIKPHWICKFMRRGFEPPMPFGKTHAVVAAQTRAEAIRIVAQSGMVSPMYPKVTASPTSLETSYHFKFTDDPSYSF